MTTRERQIDGRVEAVATMLRDETGTGRGAVAAFVDRAARLVAAADGVSPPPPRHSDELLDKVERRAEEGLAECDLMQPDEERPMAAGDYRSWCNRVLALVAEVRSLRASGPLPPQPQEAAMVFTDHTPKSDITCERCGETIEFGQEIPMVHRSCPSGPLPERGPTENQFTNPRWAGESIVVPERGDVAEQLAEAARRLLDWMEATGWLETEKGDGGMPEDAEIRDVRRALAVFSAPRKETDGT